MRLKHIAIRCYIVIVDKLLRLTRNIRYTYYINQKILIVGKYTYGANLIKIDNYKGSKAKVIIGKFCSISRGVTFITGGIHPKHHNTNYPLRIKFNLKNKYKDGMPSTNGDIVIGNDVWLGTEVLILSGVRIGNGSVVASRSIVTKDVPDYTFVGGSPAKFISSRNKPESFLENWWDMDIETVIKNIDYLAPYE